MGMTLFSSKPSGRFSGAYIICLVSACGLTQYSSSALAASSRDILKNRASILTLLYSLSKDAGCNKENQVHSSYQ